MAELTVPRAPAILGRTANVQYETPQFGGAAAELGSRMFEAGTALENDRLDREMSRLRVDMTKDMGDLRLQVEDMGDPDAAGAAWDQGISTIREKYATGTNDRGRPMVDPKNAENFDLAFDDLSNSHAYALGGRFLALRQSQRAATYYEYEQVAQNQASAADPTTRDQLYADFDAETDKMVAAGTMSPEAAAKRKQDFRQTTVNSNAIQRLQEDPEGLIEDIDAGELDTMGPEAKARYRTQAQAEMERRAAAAQKASETAAKEWGAANDERVRGLRDISTAGRMPKDAAYLDTPEARKSKYYDEAMAARDLARETPDFAMKTPDQLAAMIAEERKKPLAGAYQANRLKVLEEAHDKAVDGYRTDPIGYAAKNRPDVPTLDLSNPEAVAQQIKARVTFGRDLVSEGYVDADPNSVSRVPLLSKAEQADLTELVKGTKNPAERLSLTSGIVAAVVERGGDPMQIEALAADPVLSWASTGSATGVIAPATAAQMLRGQEAIDAGVVVLPPESQRLDPVFTQVEDLFADVDGGAGLQAQVMKAADAIYASMIQRTDPNAPINGELYQQALHLAFGGTGTVNTSSARGGIQMVNGRRTFLDDGISPAMIDNAVGSLRRDLVPAKQGHGVGAMSGSDRVPDRPARVLAAAARGTAEGTLPTINGQPLEPDDWAEATFVAVGPDRYALLLAHGGGVQATAGETDQPFTFSMKALLSGYRRGRR